MSTRFESLAENPLDTAMVSISRRIEYTDTHIGRMTQNNKNGQFDGMIADTQSKRDAFAGNLTDSKMSEAIRIAYTAEIDRVSEQFRSKVSKFEGLVKSTFEKGSLVYLMFFPHGMEEFHRANQAETKVLMENIIKRCFEYQDMLGNNSYYDSFKDLQTRYTNAYSLQKQAAGTVVNSITVKGILWDELKKQMFKNMLTLLLFHFENPGIMLTYFEPRLLRFRHKKADGSSEVPYTITIAPATTLAADISFSASDTLLIINNGTVPIFFYGAASTTDAPQAAPAELAPGNETEVTALSLGAPASKYLLLQNKHVYVSAEVEIALV